MIIHLLLDEKFTSDYIDFVDKQFNDNNEHVFLVVTKHRNLRYELKNINDSTIFIKNGLKSGILLSSYMVRADKIIVHGLFNHLLIYMMFVLNTARKTVWALWGGDLYDYEKEKRLLKTIKTKVIRKFQGIATPIEGDCNLARKQYGFQGAYYPCMLYFSNMVDDMENHDVRSLLPETYNVVIGNSADPENRHKYIIEKLDRVKFENVKLIIPLSYGSKKYADEVENEFCIKYGENVMCLRHFMEKEKYTQLLGEIDVAIYGHKRQQALGNIFHLLAAGTKVYMEPYITTYEWLIDMGVKVFDLEQIDEDMLIPLTERDKINNKKIINSIANKMTLYNQWKDIFMI